jgi:phosphoglucomutase
MVSGDLKPIDFPESNVLQFFTEGGSKISARPSGTEPKIKFYFSIRGELDNKADYDKKVQQLEEKISGIIQEMQI